MPENPLDIKPVGKLKPINISETEIKPVGKLKPISEVPDTKQAYLNAFQGIDQETTLEGKKAKTDDIINNITDITDNEKEVIRNLAKKGADTETISNSILTLQGKHKDQYGHKGYYMKEENGYIKPMPLNKFQTPKDEKLAATVFSEKTLPEELSSSFERGAIKLAQGVLRTPEFLLDATAEQNWNQTMRAAGRNDLEITSEKLGDITGIHNEPAKYVEQALAKRETDFNNVYDKGITDYIGNGEYKKAAGLLANSIAESAPTTVALALTGGGAGMVLGGGAVFAAQKKAELDKEMPNMSESDKLGIAAANGLLEGIFEQFGITKLGGIAKEILKKEGKYAGKEFIEDIFKETYKPTIGKYFGVIGEESLGEMATQFSQNAVDKYSGYKPDLDLKQGVIDAGIVGLGAASGPAIITSKAEKSKIEKSNEQSIYLYNLVQKPEENNEHVVAFKAQIGNDLKNGKLTQEEHDNAVIKVDSYQRYNNLVENKNLNLDDNNKRELFDKTFHQVDLEARAKARGDYDKLNPIDKAEYNVFEKQSHDLQKDINEIILKSQVKQETTVGKKTIKDIAKSDEAPKEGETTGPKLSPQQQALVDKYKKTEETRPFAEIPTEEWNKKTYNARDVFNKTVEHLEEQPNQTAFGVLVENPFHYKNPNETYAIEMPDGKKIRFSSSMTREAVKGEGGFKGHFRQEHFSDKQKQELEGHPMAMKAVTIPAVGEKTRGGKEVKEIKAIKIVRADNGKFIGWAKATNTGSTDVSEEQASLLEDEQMNDRNLPPTQLSATVVPPVKPIAPITQPSIKKEVKGIPSKEEFVASQMQSLSEEGDVDQDLIDNGTYQRYFENQYDKNYGKTTIASVPEQKKSTAGNNKEITTNGAKENKGKEITLKKPRAKPTRIKDASRRDALKLEVFNAYDKAMQYFIGGGKLNSDSFRGLYQTPAEIAAKAPLGELEGRANYVSPNVKTTIDDIAHALWESNKSISDDTDVWRNAVEAVLNNEPASVIQMADKLLAKTTEQSQRVQEDQVIIDVTKQAEKDGLLDEFTNVQENLEQLSDNDLKKLSKEDDKWEEEGYSDIIGDDGSGDQFQKTKDTFNLNGKTTFYHASNRKREGRLNPSTAPQFGTGIYFSTNKQLVKDEFGENVTEVSLSIENPVYTNSKAWDKVVELAIENADKAYGKSKKLELDEDETYFKYDKTDNNNLDEISPSFISDAAKQLGYDAIIDSGTSQYENEVVVLDESKIIYSENLQKRSSTAGDVKKVVDVIRKALPKIKVVYDENLNAAGKLSADGKTITINPYFAGTDTPIHEAGHVLIDAMGYSHKDIQLAIKKLENTQLWKDTKKRYQELNQENLGKEVLAEAIGREGAGIFDKETQRTEFSKILDKIFNWFKTKLGLERNVAKELAKQIIRGEIKDIGTQAKEVIVEFDKVNALKGIKRNAALNEFKQNFPTLAKKAKDITDNFKTIVNQLKETQNLIEEC